LAFKEINNKNLKKKKQLIKIKDKKVPNSRTELIYRNAKLVTEYTESSSEKNKEIQSKSLEDSQQVKEPLLEENLKIRNLKDKFKLIFDLIYLMNTSRKNKILMDHYKKKLRSLLNNVKIITNDLSQLHSLLLKFLLNKKIQEDDLELSDLEIMLFCIFLVKKNYQMVDFMKWTPESFNRLRVIELKKRSEQNYKVILKRFFKKIIKNFNSENNLNINDDLEFYKFHFEELATAHNENWRLLRYGNVFNEKHSSPLPTNERKSKKLFAKILKQNSVFMKKLNDYLSNQLILGSKTHGIHIDYSLILGNKVNLLIDKWKNRLYSNKNLKARVCKFVQDQIKNNKIKLPWGYTELDQGILNVKKLFEQA
jgi:hypothetical protein